MFDYFDTKIPWINEIPKSWEIIPLFNVVEENKRKNKDNNENVLSLSYGKIIRRDLSKNFGLLPNNFDNYQVLDKGYIVIRSTDLQNDKKSLRVGLVKEEGVITSAYIGLSPNNRIYSEYLFYYLNMCDLKKVFYSLGGGLRQNLRYDEFKRFPVIKNDIEEQKIISRYLNKKTEYIDLLIENIQKKIELLNEKKTALINKYVTKGINPDAQMKNSGIKWAGQIPVNFKLSKLKYCCSYNDESLKDDTDPNYEFNYIEVGDVSYNNGIRFKEKIKFEDSPSRARRIVKKDDVIISTVRTYLRAISIIPDCLDTICSTGFCVLRSEGNNINPEFLSYLVKSEWFIAKVVSNSYGVSYPAINSIEIMQIPIIIPPKIIQNNISERLNKENSCINEMIEKELLRINLLREYRQSLISSVVTGKIRITEEMI